MPPIFIFKDYIMNSEMLSFQKDKKRFNCRSVAVFIDQQKVLLHRVGDNPYWSLPGGRVEFMESANTTVIREMKEELDIECQIIRPLWIIENFFAYKEVKQHEIAFYFLVSVPQQLLKRGKEFEVLENGITRLHFRWAEIDSLHEEILFPTVLKSSLTNLPSTMEYIVHRA